MGSSPPRVLISSLAAWIRSSIWLIEVSSFPNSPLPDTCNRLDTLGRVITGVPVFFFQVTDPVGAGLVKQIGEPTGTNVTGRVFTVPAQVRMDFAMRLVSQTVPTDRPVVFGFVHSTYPSAMGDIRQLKAIEQQASDFRFAVHTVPYEKGPEGIPAMLATAGQGVQALSDHVDFWWESQEPLGEHPDYTRLLLERSTTPIAMGQTLDSVKMGALMHITPDLEAGGREAADLVAAILEGTNPGTIPVTVPARFQLGINLSTALDLNIVEICRECAEKHYPGMNLYDDDI